ncbi:MarR family winged helix-turn-helix transcriptional regulator [Actinoplanes sp. NPDC051851]|uniref:MarR family winged helix-turn-helix transcriptional regulator n=1 Tax=Actinoplanes sp. NPDC051851 TaxID=3154753 RepID=UPI003430A3F1
MSDRTAQTLPRLVFLLLSAERSVRRWIDARAGDTGIGAAGAGVLFHLAAHDGALIGDVTTALGASASGMSGLVARLEKSGCVTRTPDPADARAARLHLTPKGRAAVAASRAVVDDLNSRLTEGFTPAEMEVVARWLAHGARIL